jgi:hypothetical protein
MYDSISQSGADGYGNGSEGYGQGYEGSLFGGNPAQAPISYGGGSTAAPGGGGPVTNPIQFGGGGMTPGQGVPGRRGMDRSTGNASQGGLKPMLSQLLGMTPQGSQGQRRGLGGNGQGRDPRRGPIQGRPIMGGPRPMPRPVPPISGAPGGGTMRGGQGGPIQNPIQRGRVQPQPQRRQGTI